MFSLALIIFAGLSATEVLALEPEGKTAPIEVVEVVDGDTLKLANREIVRLIGVDAPEKKISRKLQEDAQRAGASMYDIMKMGRDASAVAYALISGKPVRLEYDKQKRDSRNHLLAYVYLADGRMMNAEMLASGHAVYVDETVNIKYHTKLKTLEAQARRERKGIWTEIELDMHHK